MVPLALAFERGARAKARTSAGIAPVEAHHRRLLRDGPEPVERRQLLRPYVLELRAARGHL